MAAAAVVKDHYYELLVDVPPGWFEDWLADSKIDQRTVSDVPTPHVTLMYGLVKGSGEWARVNAIVEAANITAKDWEFEGEPWFVERAKCWVQDIKSERLEALHEELAKQFPHAAIKLKGHRGEADAAVERFRPHVTLCYIKALPSA